MSGDDLGPGMKTDAARGLVAQLDELIAANPGGTAGGFDPRRRVRTRQLGGYRSVFRGRGMEFDEVRTYQPGDDIRTIDWRVTARTGRAHTKLFQEERERPVLILADARTAMRFGTRDAFKSVLAARAAALLTWTCVAEGDRVGGVVLTPYAITTHRPERSSTGVLHFLKALADGTADGFGAAPPEEEPSFADALLRLRAAARPGTLVFLISDFRDFDAAASGELRRLALQCQVTNLFVFDRIEAALPERGALPISDGAGVAVLDADEAEVRAAYARRFAARRDAVALLSRQRGMAFLPLETGCDLKALLHPERMLRAAGSGKETAKAGKAAL